MRLLGRPLGSSQSDSLDSWMSFLYADYKEQMPTPSRTRAALREQFEIAWHEEDEAEPPDEEEETLLEPLFLPSAHGAEE